MNAVRTVGCAEIRLKVDCCALWPGTVNCLRFMSRNFKLSALYVLVLYVDCALRPGTVNCLRLMSRYCKLSTLYVPVL